jgi:hypothetical protein
MNRLPWGVMGYANRTSNVTGIGTTAADITGLTLTFTADSTRIYRTTVYVPYAEQATTAGYTDLLITNSANSQLQACTQYLIVAQGSGFIAQLVETGVSGSTVRKARAKTTAGGVTFVATSSNPMQITVEDIGEA